MKSNLTVKPDFEPPVNLAGLTEEEVQDLIKEVNEQAFTAEKLFKKLLNDGEGF